MKAARAASWLSAAALCLAAWPMPSAVGQEAEGLLVHRDLVLSAPWGEEHVRVTYRRADAERSTQRLRVVVALHGQGEARRGPSRGQLGWSVDYALPDAFVALGRGRLTAHDYRDMVRPAHLQARNDELARTPFAGLAIVAPYTLDLMTEAPGSPALVTFADWVAGPLLAGVRAELPFLATRAASTGVDGVSLGGMIALEVGLRHPESFATVGAIQPAIRGRVDALAALATGGQTIRLLSSDEDPFLGVTQDLSTALRARQIAHELLVTPGPHGYDFNRGPGSIELLWFHDRTLAEEAR